MLESVKQMPKLQALATPFKADIKDLLKKRFPKNLSVDFENEDAKYIKYLKTEPTKEELIALAVCGRNLAVSARVLISVLIPEKREVFDPYYHEGVNFPDHNFSFLNDTLPLALRRYAGELFLRICQLKESLKKIDEIADSRDWDCRLLAVLGILPEEDAVAEKIFNHFDLNDEVPFSGIDDASGYNPFANLMRADNMPDAWKCRADGMMRKIIKNEAEAISFPRAKWEKAEACYLNHLHYGLIGSYGPELLEEQLRFALNLPTVKSGKSMLLYWDTAKIWNVLEPRINELPFISTAYDVVRFAVMDIPDNKWQIRSEQDVLTAQQWIERFGEEDPDLQTRIVELIMAFHDKSQEEKEEAQKAQKEKEELMEALLA